MKSKRDQAYDIRRIYEEMGLELIESMKRNLSRHKKEELKEGFRFEQWQSAKLRELERFRKDNIKILGKYIPATEFTIAKTLTDTYRNSQEEINNIVLKLKNDLIQGIDIRMPGDLEVILTPLEKELSEEMTREALEKIKAFNELPTPIDD
ncbi:MAG TPA: hypothetical protein GX731_01605, partial [Clostridiales bacterium]|nr:hypothetical protein [Clostridiales bacterium]